MRRYLRKITNNEACLGLLLIAPSFLVIGGLIFYPVLYNFWLSVNKLGFLPGTPATFVGLSHYKKVLTDPSFWNSIRTTLVFTVSTVLGSTFVGFLVALLLNREFRLRGLVRGIVMLPYVAPVISLVFAWQYIFHPVYGYFNYLLVDVLKIIPEPVAWLQLPRYALAAVIIFDIWRQFPFAFLMILARMQAIPQEHEDGINQGFDLWTNSACLRAVELAGAIYGWEEAKELASELRSAIFKHLVHDGRFVRTIDREHVRKTDADIILLAPFYFQILPAQHELLASSVDFLCERLFDAELGGYWRYEQDVYFPGPWILYSAMIARYFYTVGRRNEGDAIVQWIFANSQQGYLPEHLLTKEMFWKYRDHQVRRANNMPVEEMKEARLREIGKLDEQAQQCDVLYYACPLLWSHMETVAALLAGGYLSGFDLERDLYAASSG